MKNSLIIIVLIALSLFPKITSAQFYGDEIGTTECESHGRRVECVHRESNPAFGDVMQPDRLLPRGGEQ